MNSTQRSTFKHTKNPCSKKNSIENHWSLHQLHIVCIYFTKSTTTIKCEIIENILNRTENRKKNDRTTEHDFYILHPTSEKG